MSNNFIEFYYVGIIAYFILILYYLILTRNMKELYQDDKIHIFLIYTVLFSVVSWISALSMLVLIIRLHLKVEEYLLIDYLKENNKDKLILEDVGECGFAPEGGDPYDNCELLSDEFVKKLGLKYETY